MLQGAQRRLRSLAGLVLALILLAGCGGSATTSGSASATPVLQVTKNAKLGNILVDSKGMTVYRFTKDTKDTNTCSGACADRWKPVVASSVLKAGTGVTGQLGNIKLSDGTEQVTLNGMPLYTFVNDKQPGDTAGHGVGGIWFALAPDGTDAKAAS